MLVTFNPLQVQNLLPTNLKQVWKSAVELPICATYISTNSESMRTRTKRSRDAQKKLILFKCIYFYARLHGLQISLFSFQSNSINPVQAMPSIQFHFLSHLFLPLSHFNILAVFSLFPSPSPFPSLSLSLFPPPPSHSSSLSPLSTPSPCFRWAEMRVGINPERTLTYNKTTSDFHRYTNEIVNVLCIGLFCLKQSQPGAITKCPASN